MTEYVLIYPRCVNGEYPETRCLMVLKEKPSWQKGRLNLVGGKVEPGETPEAAAVRELEEESGFKVSEDDVRVCGRIIGVDCVVYCCSCPLWVNGDHPRIQPREGEIEKVEWHQWYNVKNDPRLMPNLQVIIPLLFMDARGWTITDQQSSLGVPKHEILVSLDIQKPFVNG